MVERYEAVWQQQELKVRQKHKASVCCSEVPDETEARDTEMVGVPESFLSWPVAFVSGTLSLEFTLATLSAPSGCVHTQIKHT